MEYIRISEGFTKSKLYPKDFDIKEIIETAGDKDYYYGIYTYEEKHYKQWLEKKSLAGIRDVKTDTLVWDFDDADNLENARQDTLECYSRLLASGFNRDDIQIYYSGNRGFHLMVDLAEKIDRKQFENIVFTIGKNLKTLDPTVKDQQRLIRMPFTKNQKSGLYDIPLNESELTEFDLNDIKEAAKDLTEESWDLYQSWKTRRVPLPSSVQNLNQTKEKTDLPYNDQLDVTRKPNWLSAPRYALQQGFFKEGQRNTAFMILATTYKANGFPKEITWRMLKGTAELQARRNGGEEYSADALWHEVIEVVYGETWKGGIYKDEENELLKKVAKEHSLDFTETKSELVGINRMLDSFKESCVDYKSKLINTGIKLIDDNVMIQKGMLVGILGAPGSGKTSFAKNYVKHVSMTGKYALFESLDMNDKMLTARLLQGECGYDVRYIMDRLDRKITDDKLNAAFNVINKQYQNVKFNDRTGATVDSIEQDIAVCKNEYGDDFNLVVIDYLEKINGPYTDPTNNSSFVARKLADLAKKYDVAILLLLQPRKAAGDPREELLTYEHIKGSSTIQQDARLIMTMWRPGFNPKNNNEDDKFVSLAVVKANLGSQVKMDFGWDGVSGTLRELSGYEEEQLRNLRNNVSKQKEYEQKRKSF